MTNKRLQAKWNKLTEKEMDLDTFHAKWQGWLKQNGLIDTLHGELHWGDNGIFSVIDSLLKLINSGKSVIVLPDPLMSSSDSCGYLVFDPRQATVGRCDLCNKVTTDKDIVTCNFRCLTCVLY